MTLPNHMRFVTFLASGAPEVMRLEQGPLPVVGEGEILVRVEAAGINRPDIAQRQGHYPPPKGASPILGLEVAGEVVALGAGVRDYAIGDKVCGLANGGGYADYCVLPAGQVLRFPKDYDAVHACALPETFFTVWANLFQMSGLKAGQSVLIHGGSSGIGTTAIQLAHAFGATVYATAGSREKCEACEKLGAKRAIHYKKEDFDAVIRAETGQGVDIILDMVGADYFARNVASLARDGCLSIIAFLSGVTVEAFDLTPIMTKRLRITGSAMRPRSASEKRIIRDDLLAHVWPLLDRGVIAPVIHKAFAFEDVVAAHRLMEEGDHIGKIVLTMS